MPAVGPDMEPIVNAADLDWTETENEDTHIKRKQLGEAAGGERLGCSLYELPAQRQAWPYHYHTGNEEAIYVLDGEGTIRLDGEQQALEAGDYVALPAGEDSAHQVINDSEGTLRYLVVSTMDDPDVMGYPDSGKVGVTAGDPPGGDPDERTISEFFRLEDGVGFWEGE